MNPTSYDPRWREKRILKMRTEAYESDDKPMMAMDREYRHITSNIRELRENLNGLGEAVTFLKKVLDPILAPEREEKAGPGMSEGMDPGTSGMAEELKILAHTADEIRMLVNVLRERVDI